MFDNVPGGANDNGGNAIFFQVACDQTHGLVAHGSDRSQNCYVGAFLVALRQGSGCRCLRHQFLAIAAVDVVEIVCYRADTTGLDEFPYTPLACKMVSDISRTAPNPPGRVVIQFACFAT